MIKNLTVIAFVLFSLISCTEGNGDSKEEIKPLDKAESERKKEGLVLLKKYCYACHSPYSSTHDNIVAPPMAAVKMRYQRMYKTKVDFVTAVVKWTEEPKKEEAIMKGAIDRFGVMPKQIFDTEDLLKIATYIYENKLEEPEWFAAHAEEMHGKNKE